MTTGELLLSYTLPLATMVVFRSCTMAQPSLEPRPNRLLVTVMPRHANVLAGAVMAGEVEGAAAAVGEVGRDDEVLHGADVLGYLDR